MVSCFVVLGRVLGSGWFWMRLGFGRYLKIFCLGKGMVVEC